MTRSRRNALQAVCLAMAALVGGCATPPSPPGPKGPDIPPIVYDVYPAEFSGHIARQMQYAAYA